MNHHAKLSLFKPFFRVHNFTSLFIMIWNMRRKYAQGMALLLPLM